MTIKTQLQRLLGAYSVLWNILLIDIKRKYSLLKVCYVPNTSAASSKAFFAAAINSTNETNTAGDMRH